MDSWEKEVKIKIEKTMEEGIKALEEASQVVKASRKPIQELEEAAQAIKASREAMEKFAFEKGFITKPVSEESPIPETIILTKAEPIEIPAPFPYFVHYERKPKEWGNWILSAEPAFSIS
ncbi:MAG: hypothetical protein Q8O10_00915 [candidate division Zixibacteria bacterium]|nr:hypothetical protein [candidate division Zixibacteria bacterium]